MNMVETLGSVTIVFFLSKYRYLTENNIVQRSDGRFRELSVWCNFCRELIHVKDRG